MDQQLQSLDPKLREAYERIMGTSTKPAAQTAVPDVNTTTVSNPVVSAPMQPIQNQMQTPPVVKPEENKPAVTIPQSFAANTQTTSNYLKPEIPQHVPAQPLPAQNDSQPASQETKTVEDKSQSPFSAPPLTAQAFTGSPADNQMHAYVSQEVAGVKQSLKTIQLIYIVGGIVFFVVYALFWLKFFDIPSPI